MRLREFKGIVAACLEVARFFFGNADSQMSQMRCNLCCNNL